MIKDLFKPKCPKCKGSEIATVKESFTDAFKRNLFNVMFPLRLFMGYAKAPKPLYVCSCGFSWEKR